MQFRKMSSTNRILLALASFGPKISIIRVVETTCLVIALLYRIDARDLLDFLPVTDATATIWHEENNLGHRQDDRRRLRPTPESRRYHLAESSLNSFERGARTRTDRSRERLETSEEKVTCA
jgi:hypothetical protein